VPAPVRQGVSARKLASRRCGLGRDPAQRNGDRYWHSADGSLRLGRRHCRLPSYVSEFEDRVVTPLLGIKPLASVKFWLTYTERVRNLEASQPILHWIRSCFDPRRHACFREVPPAPMWPPRVML
jgi:hypothetical protein